MRIITLKVSNAKTNAGQKKTVLFMSEDSVKDLVNHNLYIGYCYKTSRFLGAQSAIDKPIPPEDFARANL